MCCKLGLRHFHICLGVKGIDLVGIRLRMYVIVSKAYPQEDTRSDEKLIIDLTMFINVQFLLSATLFCCEVLGTLNWDIIPCSLRKESN